MKKPYLDKKSFHSITNDAYAPQKLLFERLANKWYVIIICHVEFESSRFNQILKRNGEISQKMLSQTLKNLEEDGMVRRTVNGNKMPVEVVYSITDFGVELIKVINPIIHWSNENLHRVTKCRKEYSKKYLIESM